MMKECRLGKNFAKMFFFFFFFFFFFVLLISPVGLAGSFAEETAAGQKPASVQAESPDIDWLVFSPTKYRHERELVEKYEYIKRKESKEGHIYIALADLDGDGTKEIFAYIDISDYCGEIGCTLGIYQIRSNKLVSLLRPEFKNGGFPIFIDSDEAGRQKVIGILQTKTMGWKDISLEGKTVWKWDGRNYQR